MVGDARLELATSTLSGYAEVSRFCMARLPLADSTQLSYLVCIVVGDARLELATSTLSVSRSNQLS